MRIRHIFTYVVRRPEDPFAGLKHQLLTHFEPEEVVEVRLSDETYATVHRTEYSSVRKNLRFLYYREVFAELERRLRAAVAGATPESPCWVYFADEGVWAEFLRGFRCAYPAGAIVAVNVQHGFEYRVPPPYVAVRRVANAISRAALGVPSFGMGPFGGAGAGTFDIYLTYDKECSAYVRTRTGDLTYACPLVIKHELWTRFSQYKQMAGENGAASGRVMFAMQPHIVSAGDRPKITGGAADVCEALVPVARAVREKLGSKLLVRPHPGMDREEVERAFAASALAAEAELDDVRDLADSLARCRMVISFDSTVLWEASILGLVPVSYQCRCFQGALGFLHEQLFESEDVPEQLERLLSPSTAERYNQLGHQQFDWVQLVKEFTESTSGLGQRCGDERCSAVGSA